ncbi:hypothetical protein [Chitinophaga nivalis]|uniref:Uncharacterized protein n=1 Tax=Chitinophaga nivalis TaxID=2991709 RepID=A0ABT3IHU2_9BACT|nr:hypothetical protein [Chitinophaga nivalis]MCW3466985.1 hypothetical protein [Chitinophaga nivalis]MCW3483324.1 hypothetical protein [Chitinophaga nivalis]
MYEISIQSPFTRHPVAYPGCDSEKAMTLYQGINWEDLYKQIEATGSSPENPFYFFEIKRRNYLGEEETLCISGCLWGLVGIGYMRPRMERKGFFKKKDVLNPRFATQMDGMDTPFAFSCLQAFIKGNTSYLEENLYNKEMD